MANYRDVFLLHTNEGKQYVRSTNDRMREAMYKYIREKRKEGVRLSEIIFCWQPITISKTI